ncbi:hypothetical protein B0T26DRAFT_632442 [Lasiosphaeria miniovina]|uniref:Uncharacterized protein n=1 Tax=Lasiosphaeria miniovina TaxID=1954250 RepID=A0AA40BEZ8_9PEZI|nr:uncharacterized protein B0T26DRAFT_632442 [Lasiosphaeria miniovina]KAK0733037.1 hypothetical protein B0T26DRAFT_632442 [Lasiosphaeria miniovina]
MVSSRASASSSRRTKSTKSTDPTDASFKSRRSSAYDENFERELIDYNVYPEGYEYPGDRLTPKPENIGQARVEFLAPRASLSPSHFPQSAFRDLKRKNNTKSKGTIMRNVIPIITGDVDAPNEGNLPFTSLESLTEGVTFMPAPGFFGGARLGDLDKAAREDLSRMIIPTKHADVAVAPNKPLVN